MSLHQNLKEPLSWQQKKLCMRWIKIKKINKALLLELDTCNLCSKLINLRKIRQKFIWLMVKKKNWNLCVLIRRGKFLTVLHSISILLSPCYKDSVELKLEPFLSMDLMMISPINCLEHLMILVINLVLTLDPKNLWKIFTYSSTFP